MNGPTLQKHNPVADQQQWTPKMVAQRLAEAANVLGRLPAMRVYSYTNLWPRLLVEYSSVVSHKPRIASLPPIEPAAIERMEETLGWSGWLKPIDSRIAWQRANGRRWKEICASVGLARAAAHEHWRYAHCLIAWQLNGEPVPLRVGRRALIARFRQQQRALCLGTGRRSWPVRTTKLEYCK